MKIEIQNQKLLLAGMLSLLAITSFFLLISNVKSFTYNPPQICCCDKDTNTCKLITQANICTADNGAYIDYSGNGCSQGGSCSTEGQQQKCNNGQGIQTCQNKQWSHCTTQCNYPDTNNKDGNGNACQPGTISSCGKDGTWSACVAGTDECASSCGGAGGSCQASCANGYTSAPAGDSFCSQNQGNGLHCCCQSASVCGNGKKESGEDCEPSLTPSQTCDTGKKDDSGNKIMGTQTCQGNCQWSACTPNQCSSSIPIISPGSMCAQADSNQACQKCYCTDPSTGAKIDVLTGNNCCKLQDGRLNPQFTACAKDQTTSCKINPGGQCPQSCASNTQNQFSGCTCSGCNFVVSAGNYCCISDTYGESCDSSGSCSSSAASCAIDAYTGTITGAKPCKCGSSTCSSETFCCGYSQSSGSVGSSGFCSNSKCSPYGFCSSSTVSSDCKAYTRGECGIPECSGSSASGGGGSCDTKADDAKCQSLYGDTKATCDKSTFQCTSANKHSPTSCSDGTPSGECSKTQTGYWCNPQDGFVEPYPGTDNKCGVAPKNCANGEKNGDPAKGFDCRMCVNGDYVDTPKMCSSVYAPYCQDGKCVATSPSTTPSGPCSNPSGNNGDLTGCALCQGGKWIEDPNGGAICRYQRKVCNLQSDPRDKFGTCELATSTSTTTPSGPCSNPSGDNGATHGCVICQDGKWIENQNLLGGVNCRQQGKVCNVNTGLCESGSSGISVCNPNNVPASAETSCTDQNGHSSYCDGKGNCITFCWLGSQNYGYGTKICQGQGILQTCQQDGSWSQTGVCDSHLCNAAGNDCGVATQTCNNIAAGQTCPSSCTSGCKCSDGSSATAGNKCQTTTSPQACPADNPLKGFPQGNNGDTYCAQILQYSQVFKCSSGTWTYGQTCSNGCSTDKKSCASSPQTVCRLGGKSYNTGTQICQGQGILKTCTQQGSNADWTQTGACSSGACNSAGNDCSASTTTITCTLPSGKKVGTGERCENSILGAKIYYCNEGALTNLGGCAFPFICNLDGTACLW